MLAFSFFEIHKLLVNKIICKIAEIKKTMSFLAIEYTSNITDAIKLINQKTCGITIFPCFSD